MRDRVAQTTFRATVKADESEGMSCLLNGGTVGPFFLSHSGNEMLMPTALQLMHFDVPPDGCYDSFHPYLRRISPPGGFTDASSTTGSTVIKAVHVSELRTRVGAIRASHK